MADRRVTIICFTTGIMNAFVYRQKPRRYGRFSIAWLLLTPICFYVAILVSCYRTLVLLPIVSPSVSLFGIMLYVVDSVRCSVYATFV